MFRIDPCAVLRLSIRYQIFCRPMTLEKSRLREEMISIQTDRATAESIFPVENKEPVILFEHIPRGKIAMHDRTFQHLSTATTLYILASSFQFSLVHTRRQNLTSVPQKLYSFGQVALFVLYICNVFVWSSPTND